MMVADDHPIFPEGISSILKKLDPDAKIDQAGTYEEMLETAEAGYSPNLFLLDLRFPGWISKRRSPSCGARLAIQPNIRSGQ